jgi:hypothetical protein
VTNLAVEGVPDGSLALDVGERREVRVEARDPSGELVSGVGLAATTSAAGIVAVDPIAGGGASTAAFRLIGESVGRATVRFRHPSTGVTLDLQVEVVLPRPPVIGLSTSSVTIPATAGASSPPPMDVLVRNEGGGTLSWFVTETAPWLAVSPISGVGAGRFVITVNSTSLTAETYEAEVAVTAPGATPAILHVTLLVASADLDFAGRYTAQAVVQAEQTCPPIVAMPPPAPGRRRTLHLAVTGTVPRIEIAMDGVVMGGTIAADGAFHVRHATPPAPPPVGSVVTTLTGTIRVTEGAAHLQAHLQHPGSFLSCRWSEAVSGDRTD